MNSTTTLRKDLEKDLKNFREAVNEAIRDNHARGLPVYQIEEGYIIALYPNDHKVRLEKVGDPQIEKDLWYRPR